MKILWVDDDVFFVTRLVGHVRDAGYDVILAEGPDEALEFFRKNRDETSLVVLDVMMPHGRELNAVESMAGYATGRWPGFSKQFLSEWSGTAGG